MRAVILAGGLGMRLRPYTTILPKPLVPVGERPILEHILRQLSSHGVLEVDLCIGHLGELIPFNIWRIDNIMRKAPRGVPCKRQVGEYLRENVYITTSGNFRTPSLLSTMLEVGADRIMYAVDYPFETHEDASRWFDTCEISENDRVKIGRENARRVFGLAL